MKKLLLLMIALIVTILPACAQAVSGQEVKSGKQRVSDPVISQPDASALVTGNTAFTLSLYQKLALDEGNLFYSPYSISEALAMTYAGAGNRTEQQMADTLDFTLPQAQLHPAFNSLDQQLHSRGSGAKGKDEKGFRLNIINAIWGQQDFTFLPAFLDTLAQNYGAGLRLMDFKKAPEPSRIAINKWVSEQTEDRINHLIPVASIDTMTRLVLTNAIYFNAAWAHQFDKNATAPGSFNLLAGGAVSVPFMKETEILGYYQGKGFQAVDLAYDGNELSMVIILPDSGQFKAVEKSMDPAQLGTIISGLQAKNIALSLPGFEFDSSFELSDILSAMGMMDAFSPTAADFSGMTGNRDLSISKVIHKSFVSVDEAGTEAAAATAVIMRATAMPLQPVEVKIDRPFMFLIRDIKTGSILFMGRVIDPS